MGIIWKSLPISRPTERTQNGGSMKATDELKKQPGNRCRETRSISFTSGLSK